MAISFYATGCSYIAHASFSVSPDPYPSGIPCPIVGVSNITGTITIRASEVYFDDGYGFPAHVYVDGTQIGYLENTYVSFSSSGVSNVQIVATETSSTVKNYISIRKGDGIKRVYYTYVSDGEPISTSTTNSTIAITADVNSDITFTNFTFTDATIYGTPITFDEYNSSYSSLITSWTTATDNKIRVKSSVRYFKFTPSLIESTYYGRFTLNANGGAFPGTGYTSISWPIGGNMSNTGTGGAYVSTSLPTAGGNYVPTRSGYAFLGWATDPADTAPDYLSGKTAGFTARSTSSSSPTKVTLYAVWSQIFTLSYSTSYSGVTNMPPSSTISGAGYITCASTIPVLSGYTFQGWAETDGGAVRYVGTNSIYISADKTLYAVFKKNTITLFYWNGSDTADVALIAKGQPVSNITAARWNNLLAKIKALADVCGVSFRYTTVSSGDDITAARFNSARTGLVNIRTTLGTSTVIPGVQSSGGTVYATLFTGNGSLKSALNHMIGVWNNG